MSLCKVLIFLFWFSGLQFRSRMQILVILTNYEISRQIIVPAGFLAFSNLSFQSLYSCCGYTTDNFVARPHKDSLLPIHLKFDTCAH